MLKPIIQATAIVGLTLTLAACYGNGYYPPVEVTNSGYSQSEASSMQYGPPPVTYYPNVTVTNSPSPSAANSMHYGPPTPPPPSPPASSSMHYGPPSSAASSMHYGPPTVSAKKKKTKTLFEVTTTQ